MVKLLPEWSFALGQLRAVGQRMVSVMFCDVNFHWCDVRHAFHNICQLPLDISQPDVWHTNLSAHWNQLSWKDCVSTHLPFVGFCLTFLNVLHFGNLFLGTQIDVESYIRFRKNLEGKFYLLCCYIFDRHLFCFLFHGK